MENDELIRWTRKEMKKISRQAAGVLLVCGLGTYWLFPGVWLWLWVIFILAGSAMILYQGKRYGASS